MDQTSLHDDIRPELSEDFNYIGITVHGKAVWVQSILLQPFKEFQKLWFRILRYTILSGNKHMGMGIHQSNKATWSAQESTVKDKVLTLSQGQHRQWYRLFQLAAYHFVKLSRTIFTLALKLSNRITFDNPKSEQILFPDVSGFFISPFIGSSTGTAKPPLFPFGVMSVFSKYFRTVRTAFFCS